MYILHTKLNYKLDQVKHLTLFLVCLDHFQILVLSYASSDLTYLSGRHWLRGGILRPISNALRSGANACSWFKVTGLTPLDIDRL